MGDGNPPLAPPRRGMWGDGNPPLAPPRRGMWGDGEIKTPRNKNKNAQF
ncbi:MAG: hypothetical protein F6K48_27555 [Okeania sp. SIO3H1]|nr:hypothetical protein [Okeania sp. SIO3H1]